MEKLARENRIDFGIIENDIKLVKNKIIEYLSSKQNFIQELISYLLNERAKFLRPSLLILSAKSINQFLNENSYEELINSAAGVELIHMASLIHDDVIDNGYERRGKITINKKYGNRIAVITGDILFIKGYKVCLDLPVEIRKILLELSERMCIGEIIEEKIEEDYENYMDVIINKTAFFFSSCCKIGGLIACEDENLINALSNFGLYFGIIYQIYDDILDNENFNIYINEIENFKEKAIQNLNIIKDTPYKEKMIEIVNSFTSIINGGIK